MLSRLYYLCCDDCGIPESMGHITSRDARRSAKRSGWKRIPGEQYCGHQKGRDLCPKCAAKESADVDPS